jgi:quercetin dioxygenase-like cupin family protein
MNRRDMLKLGLSTTASSLILPALPSLFSSVKAQGTPNPAFGSHRETENSVYYNGTVFSFLADSKVTGGLYAMYEVFIRQGLEPPPHTHTREDEIFYILEGEATFFS